MSFMRIVQTFYTNCFKEGDSCRGWLSEESNLMCWALSCLKAKQFYDIVELYTDKHGEDILINQLNLPYDEVHVALDDASIFKNFQIIYGLCLKYIHTLCRQNRLFT